MGDPQGGNGWQQMPSPNMQPQPYPGQPVHGQPYAPVYYAPPPPPKNRKIWLWVLLAILTVVVLAVAGFIGFKFYERSRGVTVRYEVTGTGTAQIVFPGNEFVEKVDLPWSKEVTHTRPNEFLLIARPLTAGAVVTCTVKIAAKVIVTDTTKDSSPALCQGRVEIR
ncbi:hypothetical protein [Mycolicibacterium peregrinum]|uniref:hypothetical protein n=1 Tax=Mycolicibacterium peregrinum TaxID=43304 RepID=UPI003AAD38DE